MKSKLTIFLIVVIIIVLILFFSLGYYAIKQDPFKEKILQEKTSELGETFSDLKESFSNLGDPDIVFGVVRFLILLLSILIVYKLNKKYSFIEKIYSLIKDRINKKIKKHRESRYK